VDQARERLGRRPPFLTHAWIRSWWEAFGAEARLHVLVARERGAVAAIAPFMRVRRRMYGLAVRSLELVANPHTPQSGILASLDAPGASGAILDHLLDCDGTWDILTLSQLPAEGETMAEIQRLSRERNLPFGIWPALRSPYVETTGDWDSYERSLRRKHRSNIRNRLARLERLGTVRLETVGPDDDFSAALEEGSGSRRPRGRRPPGAPFSRSPDRRGSTGDWRNGSDDAGSSR